MKYEIEEDPIPGFRLISYDDDGVILSIIRFDEVKIDTVATHLFIRGNYIGCLDKRRYDVKSFEKYVKE